MKIKMEIHVGTTNEHVSNESHCWYPFSGVLASWGLAGGW